jgi:hypothetical protein
MSPTDLGTVTPMLLTRFARCAYCGREVRVVDARLGQTLKSGVELPEEGVTSAADGSFVCPFCQTPQQPPAA